MELKEYWEKFLLTATQLIWHVWKLLLLNFQKARFNYLIYLQFFCISEPTSSAISLTINIDPESENSKPAKHKLHCMQAGFQPGFAVTGQSAQEKTLPVVLSF